jgi:hypothetical protein
MDFKQFSSAFKSRTPAKHLPTFAVHHSEYSYGTFCSIYVGIGTLFSGVNQPEPELDNIRHFRTQERMKLKAHTACFSLYVYSV